MHGRIRLIALYVIMPSGCHEWLSFPWLRWTLPRTTSWAWALHFSTADAQLKIEVGVSEALDPIGTPSPRSGVFFVLMISVIAAVFLWNTPAAWTDKSLLTWISTPRCPIIKHSMYMYTSTMDWIILNSMVQVQKEATKITRLSLCAKDSTHLVTSAQGTTDHLFSVRTPSTIGTDHWDMNKIWPMYGEYAEMHDDKDTDMIVSLIYLHVLQYHTEGCKQPMVWCFGLCLFVTYGWNVFSEEINAPTSGPSSRLTYPVFSTQRGKVYWS